MFFQIWIYLISKTDCWTEKIIIFLILIFLIRLTHQKGILWNKGGWIVETFEN